MGWCFCCEGAGTVIGVSLAFVLEVGWFGRGSRLAVIEGNPMRYGRSRGGIDISVEELDRA